MIPVSTADCERGFSAMNSINTELRKRMKAATLDRFVRIVIDGPQRKDFDFVTAAKSWIAIQNRRLFNNQRSSFKELCNYKLNSEALTFYVYFVR